jgi:signal transduction histidine kinase
MTLELVARSVNSRYRMKEKLTRMAGRYLAALRKHLKEGPRASLLPADGLGRQAMAIGLETLDMVKIHEQALTILVSPSLISRTRGGVIKRASTFFSRALTPIEKTHRAALETNGHLNQVNEMLSQRTVELAVTNRQLKQEIVGRKAAEEALKKSKQHYSLLLEQSRHMQEQLRHLSHQVLSAQEEERKQISRELHDEIAQTLTGINISLATLTKEATVNTSNLKKKIVGTQQLVEKSMKIMHRFACELRPMLLDELGLIPALHSYMKSFMERTGVHIRFMVSAELEQLNNVKRTVIYRVAQEALTNVARHAQASLVKVSIRKLDGDIIRMEIIDNGKSFQVQHVMSGKRNKRLGLLCMRERLEMVNGSFSVESAPGKGTIIRAQIPFSNGATG